MINIGIGVSWAKALYSVANNIIANFRARVLSYPNSIFEAGPCLDATLEELNAIGLLDNASLIVTPNAYNEGLLYDVIPNTPLGDMDVVRATTATRVNSAGLIEVVPRNLLTYSEQFDNAAWSKLRSTITVNATTSPDGTQNADKIVENTANNSHGIDSPSVSVTSGISYTSSVFAKASERRYLFLALNYTSFTSGNGVCFDLQTGTIVATGTGSSSAGTITNFGNGWYRCTITLIATATSSSVALPAIYMGNAVSSNLPAYIGDGISGLFIWGAQTEQGSTATEYFPTTTRLNIPRIDYTNGSCPSLLVEPQRTNLLQRSEEYENVYWTKSNATITSNTTISPSGIQNADTIVITSSGYLLRQDTYSITSGQSYTISIFAKNQITNFLAFGGATVAGTDVYSIENYGNGWYRHKVTRTFTATNPVGLIQYIIGTVGTHFIWGSQLELGSYPTSYIPTVASTVTRNADVISKTGISSLIGQTEGTIFVDFELLPNNANSSYVFALNDGTTTNMIRSEIYILSPTVLQFRTGTNTLGVSQGDYFTTITQLKNKMAISYSLNNLKIFINGVLVATDTSVTIPTMSAFYIGNRTLENIIGSSYKQAMLFKTQLTDAECIALTTI